MRFRRFPYRYRTVDEFYDSNRRRNRRSAWSLGYWHDEQTTVHMSWLETTEEVFVIEAPDLDHGPVEVLARLPSVEAVEAILDYPNGDDLSLGEARRRLADAPRAPARIDAVIAERRDREARRAEEYERRLRESFEAVDLRSLPDVDPLHDDFRDDPSACPCGYHDADWNAIAEATVAALDAGVDPLDQAALAAFAERALSTADDQLWFDSLFSDPIVAQPGGDGFTNGRHRTHALRLAGVEKCVVDTGAGFRAASVAE